MKRLIVGVFGVFALLLGGTIYVANRSYDGLVERRYYQAAASEFADREEEARAGFSAVLPDRYRTGGSRFTAALSTSDGPLRGARATLAAMRISGAGEDREYALREESPGAYVADILLPSPGKWMFSLTVEAGRLRARRRWTAAALPGGNPPEGGAGTLRGFAGGQEVRLSISPWPPRGMRDLSFAVDLPGYSGPSPFLDLSMPGMEMGRNRVDLSPGAAGRFLGTGVAVRCPSGRRDWEAGVTVPGRGKAVFRFDLAD